MCFYKFSLLSSFDESKTGDEVRLLSKPIFVKLINIYVIGQKSNVDRNEVTGNLLSRY